MKSIVLLNSNEDTRQVEDEEKSRFVREILETLGLPLNGIWNEDGVLSTDGKIKLRSILFTYKIQIIDDMDGGLKIYIEDDKTQEYTLVGEWKKCTYVLKTDFNQINPLRKLYLQMEIDHWSIFENT